MKFLKIFISFVILLTAVSHASIHISHFRNKVVGTYLLVTDDAKIHFKIYKSSYYDKKLKKRRTVLRAITKDNEYRDAFVHEIYYRPHPKSYMMSGVPLIVLIVNSSDEDTYTYQLSLLANQTVDSKHLELRVVNLLDTRNNGPSETAYSKIIQDYRLSKLIRINGEERYILIRPL